MGVLKYDTRMEVRTASIRMTEAQSNSLSAIAHAMSLTVSDVIRFAVDELVEDIPEPRVFRTVTTRPGLGTPLRRR
jgi:predicted DNA-binding protein